MSSIEERLTGWAIDNRGAIGIFHLSLLKNGQI